MRWSTRSGATWRATRAIVLVGALAAPSRAGDAEPTRPPLEAPVLRFDELFAPAGRRGLEYSATARALDGQRVRVRGYMVRQEDPAPGSLLLAPIPLTLHEHEYGLADDLPPTAVQVFVPTDADRPVPWMPGPLMLTGTLDLGPREEPGGRVSAVRLLLDPPVPPEQEVCAPGTHSP